MFYWFLPALLFFVELGVVYGVTTAAPVQDSMVYESESPALEAPQEVRLVVVNSRTNDTDAVTEEVLPKKHVPVKRISDEEKQKLGIGTTVPEDAEDEEEITGTTISTPTVSEVVNLSNEHTLPTVPFYSQFADITSPAWQKVGCGIASLAMLIDYYTGEVEPIDSLLNRGIASGAYLDDAGWIHAGLIDLSRQYGLTGETVSLAQLTAEAALKELSDVLEFRPVIASVHYTFEPSNPIPHLVVITGLKNGLVYYNDPAESTGGGVLSVEKFQRAWKKRYIEIHPV